MKNKILLSGLLLIAFCFQSFAQQKSTNKIPYGDDFIIEKDANGNERYVLDGREWNCRFITYFFENGTGDIAGAGEEAAVERAMRTWEWATNLNFLEVCNANDADLRISWERLNHGDGANFDGDNCLDPNPNVLAHAFFPPPNNGALAGDLHFDDDEAWNLNGNLNCNQIDMETVALHELGHSLGLRHSDRPDNYNAVMEAAYEGQRRGLTWDDRSGIRRMYGRPVNEIIGPTSVYSGYPTPQRYDFLMECLPQGIQIVEWDVDFPLQIVGQNGRSVTIQVPTLATNRSVRVLLTIRNDCGQQWFYSKTINILNVGNPGGCPGCPIPLAPSMGNESTPQLVAMTLFPNPVQGNASVNVSVQNMLGEDYHAADTEVRIVGITGKQYLQQTIDASSGKLRFRTSDLPVGLYFVQVVRNGDVLGNERLVIAR